MNPSLQLHRIDGRFHDVATHADVRYVLVLALVGDDVVSFAVDFRAPPDRWHARRARLAPPCPLYLVATYAREIAITAFGKLSPEAIVRRHA